MTTNAANIVAFPRLLFRPDPVIGWSLTPGYAVRAGFRKGVLQHIGPDGWRHVPGRPETGPRVAVYGCSFTYGPGLADDETFTARLQRALPGMRILNRGIGGHGTVQNLLQLRRDIAKGAIDAAVFALISDHRFRNIAHPQRMRQYLNRDWYRLGVEQVPVARLNADGRARILYHPLWQPVIEQADFDIFLPDDYMINAATLAVLDLVRETARIAGVPLRFVLLDSLDPGFSAAVQGRFTDTLDISTPYDQEHTFLPQDIHPNVAANVLFAERLQPVITGLCDALPTEGADMTAPGYTLGISSHFHDSAAALVQGNRIVAAAQEERFSREKADWRFPEQAIRYCLSQLPDGAAPEAVAYYEDPGLKTRRILDTARSLAPRGAQLWPQMLNTLRTLSDDLPRQLLQVAGGDADRLAFVPHHRSHAAAAFYPSPFERAAVLVLDGVGEWSTTTLWSGDAGGLTAQGEIRFPHSLGLFYSAFTQYCGFKVNSGEYKLMGLAPFGVPRFRQKILDELIDLRDDGSFALNMAYFGFDKGLSTTAPLFEMLFGQPERCPDAAVTPFHMNLAASAQAVLEEAVLRLAKTTLQRTGQRNLCLAGGVALNCLANSRVRLELPGLDGFWIQPAAGDVGGALGAALEVAQSCMRAPSAAAPSRKRTRDTMSASLLGPEYSDAQIRATLDAVGLTYQEIAEPQDYAAQVAAALADKQIVGHFHGRMEFGPRALGNRSILADPHDADTLSRVNRSIKFREDWRPFAPIVLADRAADYFEAPTDSPYMLFVATLKPDFRGAGTLAEARARGLHTPMDLQRAVTSNVAAVTHVDFSARLQTIDPDTTGSRVGAILRAFDAATGCPMLLNTSFNVRGEPIVCDPKDAIDCFLNTHLDLLAIGPFLVRKSAQPDWVKQKSGGCALPLTDIADLMERMMTLLTAAAPLETGTDTPAEPGPKSQSLLAPPMPELNAPLRSFTQVYGDGGQMLTQLCLDAAAQGAPELATLLNALDQGLRDGAFDLPSVPDPAPRLGRYVYPVV